MNTTKLMHSLPQLLFLIVGLNALVVLVTACGSDKDTVIVDFSKTVAVERQVSPAPDSQQLKVAVAAMISPKETFVYYRQLLDYIGENLGYEVQLVQRKTYGEINELLGKGQIDLAFICSGPYVGGKDRYGFELLATPQVKGSHFYRSYLIVNAASHFKRLEDLKGRVFAFTDPDSNTGRLVPTYWLRQIGQQPETFFSKTVYTYSHDNSILAVARALVDGATVDGLPWEYFHNKNPELTTRTRIIKKSEPYGIPPIVAARYLPAGYRERIGQLLFSMHQNPKGKKILNELMIDRFIPAQEQWYESIQQMDQLVGGMEKTRHANAQT